MEPLISVIVPIYNVEPYLRKCVDSILNQTYQNLEVILVDDGSPDNCGTICDEYAEIDRKVRVIHKKNGGQATARNIALEIASGDYIAFVDGDDWLDEKLYECVMNTAPFDVALFGCTYVNAQDNGRRDNRACDESKMLTWAEDSVQVEEIIQNSLFGYACNKVYSRTVIGDFRVPNAPLREDFVFNMKVFGGTKRIQLVDCSGYYYVQHEGSSLKRAFSGSIPDICTAAEQMLVIHPDLSPRMNRRLANHVIKQYICDAVYKFVFMNPALSERDAIEALRKIFCSKMISKTLRFYPGDGALFMLLVLCVKIKAPKLFYRVMKRKWNV